MAAKQIIILNSLRDDLGSNQSIRALFWLATPVANQVRNPSIVSAYPGATDPEILALQNGSVREEEYSAVYPAAFTLAQLESDLAAKFSSRQGEVTAELNPNQWFGTNFDGTTWTPAAQSIVKTSRYVASPVDISLAVGDNTIVAGVAGTVISVYQFILGFSAACIIRFKDGASNSLTGPLPMTASSNFVWDFSRQDEPFLVTTPGNSLVINSSAVVTMGGRGWYRQS